MNDDRFGDRVSLSDISNDTIEGNLPHPQDPWEESDNMETPFAAQPFATRNPSPPTQPQPVEVKPKAAPVGQRPVPSVSRVSRKETNTLKRFREIFGLQRVAIQNAVLERKDPEDLSKNIQMTFGLRGLNHEDYQWVLGKVQELLQNPKLATFAWKISFVSMGVASIDGVPIWDVLGFVPLDPEHTRDPMYPHMGLRFQAADAFCEELRTSLFDTVEHLYDLYESKVDSKYLPNSVESLKKTAAAEEEAGEHQGPLPPTGSKS